MIRSVRLGMFLKRQKEPVRLVATETYDLVTIRMYHKGVVKRGTVTGANIKSEKMYTVRSGQFILSGIDARNGAFGIVPVQLDGAVITSDFWTHDIDTNVVDEQYFYWLTTTPKFYEACIRASEGTTNRQRLQSDKFYAFEFMLPTLAEQKQWAGRFSSIKSNFDRLITEIEKQKLYIQLLRQTILQEAVQGKLTQQNPADEPASELLKRIKVEKQKMIKEAKLKKEKELPLITDKEIPFALPKGWIWCRLGEITNYGTSPKVETKNLSGNIWLLELEDIEPITSKLLQKVQFGERKSLSTKNVFRRGDVLYSKLRPYLDKVIVADEDGVCSSEILPLSVYDGINADYLRLRLKAPDFIAYANSKVYGMNLPRLGSDDGRSALFPLPPFTEQKRIVAKVQVLQGQITELEIQAQLSRSRAQTMLNTILKEAFNFRSVGKMKEDLISFSHQQSS